MAAYEQKATKQNKCKYNRLPPSVMKWQKYMLEEGTEK